MTMLFLTVITVTALVVVGAVAAYTAITVLHERKSRQWHEDTEARQVADGQALTKADAVVKAREAVLADLGSKLASRTARIEADAAAALAEDLGAKVKAALSSLTDKWATLNADTSLNPLRTQIQALEGRVRGVQDAIAAAEATGKAAGDNIDAIDTATGFIDTVNDRLDPMATEMLLLKQTVDEVPIKSLQDQLAALEQAVQALQSDASGLSTKSTWSAYAATVAGKLATDRGAVDAVDAAVHQLPSTADKAARCQAAKDSIDRVGALLGVSNGKLMVKAPMLCVQGTCVTKAQLAQLGGTP